MFIDLHSHILHGVDDGPESLEMAVEMIQFAADNGIRAICATPHVLDSLQNEDLVISRFKKISETVREADIPIDLYLGAEINFQFGIEEILESPIGTYRGMGRYFLVETTLTHFPKHFESTIQSVINSGRRAIFAHPERVGPIVGDIDLLKDLTNIGILLQVNAGSLLGNFGSKTKNFAWDILENKLASFVASDAHDMRRRAFNLKEVWQRICDKYDDDTADRLMFDNPMKVIMGERFG